MTPPAQSITTLDGFKDWIRNDLRRLFPHEMTLNGWGHLNAGGVSLDFAVTVDFPATYIKGLRNRAGGIESPILRRWIAEREPLLFDADAPGHDTPAEWLRCFRSHDLRNCAAHGQYDARRCVATFHSFYRVPGRLGAKHAEALRELVPVVHEVLCRVIDALLGRDPFATRLARLSGREKQVTDWAKLGKTNGEIASLCGLSQNTVKHHLSRIFDKLGVENRGELAHRLAEHEAGALGRFTTRIL
jgi:DNA-binding CsgD family transcriptional regulator